jgi:hypothetical protein
MQEKHKQDAKTTRWYFRYHKAQHEKARPYGGFEFGDQRCPICQMWNRVFELKIGARNIRRRFEAISKKVEQFQESLEGLEW